jgi:HD-like signal output (HDOD) protein
MKGGIAKQKKVLFVDDEINILKSLRRELFQSDFEILIANSGKEGLDILEKEDVAVVVSDVKMPNMDGIQFLQIVKEKYPNINRVILSGFVEQSLVVSSIIQGIATTYFAKPWDKDVLKKNIEHILDIESILNQKELLSIINSIEKLPTLPVVYEKFITAIHDELPIKKIAGIIDEDVSLAARILRVANSAFYGKLHISSVERAIIHLGLNTVKDIVLTVSIANKAATKTELQQCLSSIFTHSSLVNQVIRKIYWIKKGNSLMDAYSSIGITHDIGKIIMIQYLPERFKTIRRHQSKNRGKSFYDSELELGFEKNTHSDIGAYFLSWWNLPTVNVEVAMYHHTPEKSVEQFEEIVSYAAFANDIVTYLEQHDGEGEFEFSRFENDLISIQDLEEIVNGLRSKL